MKIIIITLTLASLALVQLSSETSNASPASASMTISRVASTITPTATNACLAFVFSQLAPPTITVATEIDDWAKLASENNAQMPCSFKLNGTLSEAYMSWYTGVSDWLETVQSKAKGVATKCGSDNHMMKLDYYCPSTQTVAFAFEDFTEEVMLKPFKLPDNEIIYFGQGVRQGQYLALLSWSRLFLEVLLRFRITFRSNFSPSKHFHSESVDGMVGDGDGQ